MHETMRKHFYDKWPAFICGCDVDIAPTSMHGPLENQGPETNLKCNLG